MFKREINREQASNFVKAVVEGLDPMKNDKPLAMRLIKKYLRLDGDSASISYGSYSAKHGEGVLPLPAHRGLEFVINEVAKSYPNAAGATPESLKLVEPSISQEIQKSGFIDRAKG